jgi:hypothetical protein
MKRCLVIALALWGLCAACKSQEKPPAPPPSPAPDPVPTVSRAMVDAGAPAIPDAGPPVSAVFSRAETGESCLELSSGRLRCWKSRNVFLEKYARLPPGELLDLDLEDDVFCAALADGRIRCRYSLEDIEVRLVGGARPVQVAVARRPILPKEGPIGCAVLADATIQCWHHGSQAQVIALSGVKSAALTRVDACVLLRDGAVRCWRNTGGAVSERSLRRPRGLGRATHLSASERDFCARMVNGVVRCWGDSSRAEPGVSVVIQGVRDAVSLDASQDLHCVLRARGDLLCLAGGAGDALAPEQVALAFQEKAPTDAARIGFAGHSPCLATRSGAIRCFERKPAERKAGPMEREPQAPAVGAFPVTDAAALGVDGCNGLSSTIRFLGWTQDGRQLAYRCDLECADGCEKRESCDNFELGLGVVVDAHSGTRQRYLLRFKDRVRRGGPPKTDGDRKQFAQWRKEHPLVRPKYSERSWDRKATARVLSGRAQLTVAARRGDWQRAWRLRAAPGASCGVGDGRIYWAPGSERFAAVIHWPGWICAGGGTNEAWVLVGALEEPQAASEARTADGGASGSQKPEAGAPGAEVDEIPASEASKGSAPGGPEASASDAGPAPTRNPKEPSTLAP